MKRKNGMPSTVRFSDKIAADIELAAKETGLPVQEIIRLATAIGLKYLKRINYDQAEAIIENVESKLASKPASTGAEAPNEKAKNAAA